MQGKWIGVGLVALGCSGFAFAFVGCGSEASDNPNGGPDGGIADALPDGIGERPDGGGQCKLVGGACETQGDCCTDTCDPNAKVCATAPGKCGAQGDACGAGNQCCTYACVDRKCLGTQCISDNEACTVDGECCGGKCEDSACKPLNLECKSSGNKCGDNAECCSKLCTNGLCAATSSYCIQSGDACGNDLECCGGKCTIAAGATLGTCGIAEAVGVGGCTVAGIVCGGVYNGESLPTCGGECCSRSCRPHPASGVLICQPPSGCHPTGETCRENSDCCGGDGRPDNDSANIVCDKAGGATVGRCTQGTACTPAGGICRLKETQCNENANCCAGNTVTPNVPPTCKQDNLGIPRCLVEPVTCTDSSAYIGKACATSADCCNLPCTQDASGNYVCNGAQCVNTDGKCTNDADCCAGPLHARAGIDRRHLRRGSSPSASTSGRRLRDAAAGLLVDRTTVQRHAALLQQPPVRGRVLRSALSALRHAGLAFQGGLLRAKPGPL
jgi:hypothetical protein